MRTRIFNPFVLILILSLVSSAFTSATQGPASTLSSTPWEIVEDVAAQGQAHNVQFVGQLN